MSTQLAPFTVQRSQGEKGFYISGPGLFAVDVVGESHYQNNLESICGKKTEENHDDHYPARLIQEEDNTYDDQAVRVEIQGKTVGHLRRDVAPQYRQRMMEAGHSRAVGVCAANVRGGWKRGEDEGHFGVWLDLPTVGSPAPEMSPGADQQQHNVLTRRIRIARLALPVYVWILSACCLLSMLCVVIGQLPE